MCLIKILFSSPYAASGSSLSSIIFDDVEEHDSEDSFVWGETDIIAKDMRTVHG